MRVPARDNIALMIILFAALLLVALPARADIPVPFSFPGGILVADTGIVNYTFGDYREEVWSDSGNSFCPGCLTFIFQFSNLSGTGSFTRATTSSFTGFLTEIGFVDPSVGIAPTSVDRLGGVIGFDFASPPIDIGHQSAILTIVTDANAYYPGTIDLIGQGIVTLDGFAPAVPEPSSVLLTGTMIALVAGGYARRRLRRR